MDGILLFNKPIGWTSHDVVAFVRRRLGVKAGHAGTLDPMATGLLLVLVGAATRLSSSLADMDKEYRGVLELGIETDTQDLEGIILKTSPVFFLESQVVTAMEVVAARSEQIPPAFSAIKQDGVTAYQRARRGEDVALVSRPAKVHSFKMESYDSPYVEFCLSVAKGFYIRTYCHDVGQVLGCGATLNCLVRTRIGPHQLERSCTIGSFTGTPPEIWRRLLSAGAVVTP